MLKKIKDLLGIEGVKIGLEFDDPIQRSEGAVFGHVILSSLSDQTVAGIEIKLVEKYQRGRKESRLIDEYELGKIYLSEKIDLVRGQEVKIPFTLPYNEIKSEMDSFGDKNFISRGISAFAKALKGVRSDFKVVAKANVAATTLDPIAARIVILE